MHTIAMRKSRRGIASAMGLAIVTAAMLFSVPRAIHAQTEVRDVDNPAAQPFQAELVSQDIPVIQEANNFLVTTVPLGKRLVIEHVTLRVAGGASPQPGGDAPFMHAVAFLETTAGGTRSRHELAVNRLDLRGFNRNFSIASQPIRAYADPGSQVLVQVSGASAVRDATLVRATVSGYLVDRIEAIPVPQGRR